MDDAAVLGAFDAEVRRGLGPDGTGALVEKAGPVVRRLARHGHAGSGVLWSDLDARSAPAVVAGQVAFFAARGEPFEWKLYDYDRPPELAALLAKGGLIPAEPEAMMVATAAEVASLAAAASPPAGVRLARVTGEAGVAALLDVHRRVFGRDDSGLRESLLCQLATAPERTELVVAMAGDDAVSAARIEFTSGTQFAGLWGGGTIQPWRRRGIYQALVGYRAALAVRRGYRYLTVDASDDSRPILQRMGFRCLAITTPYNWSPAEQQNG